MKAKDDKTKQRECFGGTTLLMTFRIVLTKNNLKLIRFHDLRYSCASLLYANSVDLKQIEQKREG